MFRQTTKESDSQIHSAGWQTTGRSPRISYATSQIGLVSLGYQLKSISTQPTQIIPSVKQKKTKKSAISTKIQQNMKENQVVVSIVHCDGCQLHKDTTHHDSDHYRGLAKALRDLLLLKFPQIKVLIQPLSTVYDETTFEKKIGAFEIEVASKKQGMILKDKVASKLKTKKWPKTKKVVNKIENLVFKINLQVQLLPIGLEMEELQGIQVKMCSQSPKFLDKTNLFSSSWAPSTFKPKSQQSSFFNSLKKYLTNQNNLLIQSTNNEGYCIFSDIVPNTYNLIVQESDQIKSCKKKVNIQELRVFQQTAIVFLQIVSNNLCDLTVEIRDSSTLEPVFNANIEICNQFNKYIVPQKQNGVYQLLVPKSIYSIQIHSKIFQSFHSDLNCQKSSKTIQIGLFTKSDQPNYEIQANIFKIIPQKQVYQNLFQYMPFFLQDPSIIQANRTEEEKQRRILARKLKRRAQKQALDSQIMFTINKDIQNLFHSIQMHLQLPNRIPFLQTSQRDTILTFQNQITILTPQLNRKANQRKLAAISQQLSSTLNILTANYL